MIAPQREQSGVGTAITLRQPIGVSKVATELNRVEAYAVAGTPADCVILGVRSLFPEEIDIVISGINMGPNIGHDNFVSGTVGAAIQGYLHGIPSLAVSLNAYEDLNFDAAARLVSLLADRIKNGDLPKEILLSVNLPNLPLNEIQGIEVTSLSNQSYCNAVEENCGCGETYYRIMRNKDTFLARQGTDIWALQLNRASITPLLNKSSVGSLKAHLQELLPAIYDDLRAL